MGCYTVNCVRYVSGTNPTGVLSANPVGHPKDPSRVDSSMAAVFSLPSDATADIKCNFSIPGWGPFGILPDLSQIRCTVTCEGGTVQLDNYVMPTVWHTLTVSPNDGKKRIEKVYKFAEGKGKGEDWWTTYRYQLEAFVDAVKGRTPQTWISADDSVSTIKWVDEVYKKSGLGRRPTSSQADPGNF